jgi:dipeptidyl aminopeptidase/acylaminoacyl peptidase
LANSKHESNSLINSYESTFVRSSEQSTEVLWNRPRGQSKLPLIVLVHGHMENRIGAALHLNFLNSQRRLFRWNACIASISQPGYGKSTGPSDYCGPRTQRAVIDVICHFKSLDFVDPSRVALIGYSRGAIVAAMVAAKMRHLSAVVLGSGFYDFEKYYSVASAGIRRAIETECEAGPEAFWQDVFLERSALAWVEKISAPTLVFHGGRDERGGFTEAKEFVRRISENGTQAKGVFLKDCGHHIPIGLFLRETKRFIGSSFGSRSKGLDLQ